LFEYRRVSYAADDAHETSPFDERVSFFWIEDEKLTIDLHQEFAFPL
jgi:hypothetical protein